MAALVSRQRCHKVATIAGDKSKKMIDQFKRVYGIDGVAPSVCSVRGGDMVKPFDNNYDYL